MFSSKTTVRVRYGETDKMGYVYYGNYAEFYEVGRVEALRTLGISYREIEEKGVMLPVYTFSIKYLRPAFYDDVITIVTRIKELPQTRIAFEYEAYNQKQELLNKGETTLVFVDAMTMKPIMAPDFVLEKLNPYFK